MHSTRITAATAMLLAAAATHPAAGAQGPASFEPAVRRVRLAETVFTGPHGTLSPDGRWFVFSREEGNGSSLWSVATAGGEPQRLTSAGQWDFRPKFLPSGDRLAFVSSRPAREGDRNSYAMVMPFDPETGRTAGTPRQLAIEPTSGLSPSPDGRWVLLHEPDAQTDSARLRLVPTEGGRGRLLATFPFMTSAHTWSADSREVYSIVRERQSTTRTLVRTPVEGGGPAVVHGFTGPVSAINVRDRYVVQSAAAAPSAGRGLPSVRFVSFDGRILATLRLPTTGAVTGVSSDGRTLFGYESDDVAPIRIVPLAGGPARQVTTDTSYHAPIGWTADAKAVIARVDEASRRLTRVAPIDGTAPRTFSLPDDAPMAQWHEGVTPTHVAYTARDAATGRRRLVALNLTNGSRTELSANLAESVPFDAAGAGGGSGADGNDFLIYEPSGERIELRARTPGGAARLVRSFPADVAAAAAVAVAGPRVAWTEPGRDSIRLFWADAPGAPARRLAAFEPPLAGFSTELRWSRDGRSLAWTESLSAIRIVEVPASGPPTGSRLIETGAEYLYQLSWTRDGGGLTYVVGDDATARVGYVSLRDGGHTSILTPPETGPTWFYSLSPDGRFVAYPDPKVRGAALWTLDLQGIVPDREGR